MSVVAAELEILVTTNTAGAEAGLAAVDSSLSASTVGMGLAGAASVQLGKDILGIGLNAIKTGAEFEQEMTFVDRLAGDSGSALGALQDKALQMGEQTVFSAQEAAQGMEQLAREGFTPLQIIGTNTTDSLIQNSADLAGALGVDMPTAANALGQFFRVFQDQGMSVETMSNDIGQAVLRSGQNLSTFMNGIQYASQLADITQTPFMDLATTTSFLESHLDKARNAGTSLRTMFTTMLAPTDKQKAAFQQLGDETGVYVDTSKGLMSTIGQLHDAFGKLTVAQQAEIAKTLVGQNAIGAFLALVQAGPAGLQAFMDKEQALGSMHEIMTARLDNLAGSMHIFASSVFTAEKVMGDSVAGAIKPFVDGLTTLVNLFISAPTWVHVLAESFFLLGGVALIAAGAVALLGTGIGAAFLGVAASAIPIFLGLAAAVGLGYLAYRGLLDFLGSNRGVVGFAKDEWAGYRAFGIDPVTAALLTANDVMDRTFGVSIPNLQQAIMVVQHNFQTLRTEGLDPVSAGLSALASGFDVVLGPGNAVSEMLFKLSDASHAGVQEFQRLRKDGFDPVSAGLFALSDGFDSLLGKGNTLSAGIDVLGQVFHQFYRVLQGKESVGTALDNIGDAVDRFGQSIANTADNILPGSGAVIDRWATGVGIALEQAKLGFEHFASEIASGDFSGALATLADGFALVGGQLLAAVEAIPWGDIGQRFKSLLQSALDLAVTGVKIAAGWLIDVGVPTLVGWTTDALGWLAGKIQAYLDLAAHYAWRLAGWVIDVAVPTLVGWVTDAMGWIEGKIKSYIDLAAGYAWQLVGWVINVAVPNLVGWTTDAMGWIEGKIQALIDVVKSYYWSLTGWAIDVTTPSVTNAGRVTAAIGSAIGHALLDNSWLSGIAHSVGSALGTALGTLFTPDPSSFFSFGTKIGAALHGAVVDGVTAVGGADWGQISTDIVTNIANSAGWAAAGLASFGANMDSMLAGAITGAITGHPESFSGVLTDIYQAIFGASSGAGDPEAGGILGGDNVLANGIISFMQDAANQAEAAAEGIFAKLGAAIAQKIMDGVRGALAPTLIGQKRTTGTDLGVGSAADVAKGLGSSFLDSIPGGGFFKNADSLWSGPDGAAAAGGDQGGPGFANYGNREMANPYGSTPTPAGGAWSVPALDLTAFQASVRSVDTEIVGMKAAVQGALSGMAGVFGNAFQGALATTTGVMNGIRAVVASDMAAVALAVSSGLSRVPTMFGTAFQGALATTTGVMNGVRAVVATDMAAIALAVSSGLSRVPTMFGTAWQGALATTSGTLTAVKTVATNDMTQIQQAVTTHIQAAGRAFETVLHVMSTNATTYFTQMSQRAITTTTSMQTGVITHLNDMAHVATLAVNNMVMAVIQQFADLGRSITTFLTTLDAGVQFGFAQMSIVAITETTGMVTGVISQFNDLSTTAEQAMQNLASGVSAAFQTMSENAVQAASGMESQVLGIIQDLGANGYDAAFTSGSAIGQGLADGLNSMTGSVQSAANALASAANAAITAAAGIASPSKVWRYFGRMMGAGLVQGLDESRSAVASAVDRLPVARAGAVAAGGLRAAGGDIHLHVHGNFIAGRGAEEWTRAVIREEVRRGTTGILDGRLVGAAR